VLGLPRPDARWKGTPLGDVLVVDRLVKRYGQVEAVKGVSFAIAPGEVFALIGPNGAGKTTTLRTVATILRPTSGSVTTAGIDALARPDAVRELISYLPEEAGAYKHMTGEAYLGSSRRSSTRTPNWLTPRW
jgi:ABC-2 type transport system ATP-binding protein